MYNKAKKFIKAIAFVLSVLICTSIANHLTMKRENPKSIIEQITDSTTDILSPSPEEDPNKIRLNNIQNKIDEESEITKSDFIDYFNLMEYKAEQAETSVEQYTLWRDLNSFYFKNTSLGGFKYSDLSFDEQSFVINKLSNMLFLSQKGFPKREEETREYFDNVEKIIRNWNHLPAKDEPVLTKSK